MCHHTVVSSQRNVGRDIPEGIKREVRRRCGFGCVICGLPLYEYEHMLEFAKIKRHVATEITLLCDRHHREKTGGLLPMDSVVAADRDPINVRTGTSAPYQLHYSGDSCVVAIGGNEFRMNRHAHRSSFVSALTIDDASMIGFELEDEGQLLLTMNLFDEGNERVLAIQRNELVYSATPWDISLEGRRLQVREGRGQFLIEILFNPPGRVSVSRGHFLYNGVDLMVTPEYALVVNDKILFAGNVSDGAPVGIAINQSASWGGFFSLGNVGRVWPYSKELRKEARLWARTQLERD